MKKFREAAKAIDKHKEGIDRAIKVASLGVGAAGVAVNFKRKKDEEKQHKEQTKEIRRLGRRLKKIEDKQKEFSVRGGSPKKATPLSLVDRALRYTVLVSIYNQGQTRGATSEDLYEVYKTLGFEDKCHYNEEHRSDYGRLKGIYRGETLVLLNDSGCNLSSLEEVLSSFCDTFKNADYISEQLGEGTYEYIIEIYIPSDSLEFLVRHLVEKGIVLQLTK